MVEQAMVKINEEVKSLIEGQALALATVSMDGNPHCIGVGNVKVVGEDKVLVGDNYMVETLENLRQNNNVALTVWHRDWEKKALGYELRGTAEYFSEGEWKKKIEEVHKGFPAKGAVLVTVTRIKKLVG